MSSHLDLRLVQYDTRHMSVSFMQPMVNSFRDIFNILTG